MAGRAIVVEGLSDLQRAFAVADKETAKEFRHALRAAAEPVRVDAEHLARARIGNMTDPWSRMRVGVTRNSVYVAPRSRSKNRRRRRKNLADLLLNKSMIPALEVNTRKVERKVDQALADVGRKWEHV